MPDISMCTGDDCPSKDICYRHRAVPNELWQLWFTNPPWADPDNRIVIGGDPVCIYFSRVHKSDRVREVQHAP